MQEFKHFINGEFVGSASGKTFANINPATNQTIGIVHEAGKAEVDQAVAAAKAALKGPWGNMPTAERMAILHKVADGITARFDEFLEAECLDTGKPKSLASHIDIPRGAANFKVFADLFKNVPTESFMLDTPDGKGALNYSVRKPKGVIAVISPWNLPLLLIVRSIAITLPPYVPVETPGQPLKKKAGQPSNRKRALLPISSSGRSMGLTYISTAS